MEGILERYLSIFVPFLATVMLGHLILRSSGSWQLERTGLASLASPRLLRRVLTASGAAIAIIVTVDLLTAGDLFLRPSDRSVLLIGIVLVTLVAGSFALRATRLLLRSRWARRSPRS
jgi:hypothetical protein